MTHPLVIIVVAQLFGTSLWFSANATADALATAWGIGAPGIGAEVVTSLSQMDFSIGIEAGLCIVILAITVERLLEATIAGNWLWKQ